MLRWAIPLCCVALSEADSPVKPMVTWSTYLGVADCDDPALWRGSLFLACHSPESDLPIQIAGSQRRGGTMAAYVLRLDLQRGNVAYATRVQAEALTAALRITTDEDGRAFVTGLARGPGLPVTDDAVQPHFGGGRSDAFLVAVAPDGQVAYGTYLGGAGDDVGNAVKLDGNGGVVVGGTTTSADFPGQTNAADRHADAFISSWRLSNPSSHRSVVFGGSSEEKLTGIELDGKGGVFAVGFTKSNDFPVHHPVQPNLRGASDLFLARIEVSDLTIAFSTYLGGSGDDSGWGVTVDGVGAPVVAGVTDSGDLPASDNAFQRMAHGGLDSFVATLDGSGYEHLRLTYFGGSQDDSSGFDGENVRVDSHGRVWLVGLTASADLPVRNAVQDSYGGQTDGFVAVFSPRLTDLSFGTFCGGSGRDILEGITDTPSGTVAVTGLTFSNDHPMPGRVIRQTRSSITVGGDVVNAFAWVFRNPSP
ncbi:MAG: hypothetical protein OXN89_16350 [Bryobacterales bacterium]|nr:hypothetical protein [Bryobacterales bacterium]